jgi:hypothetical protein
MRATCPALLIFLDLMTLAVLGEYYKLRSLLRGFLQSSIYPSPLALVFLQAKH